MVVPCNIPITCPSKLFTPRATPSANSPGPAIIPWETNNKIKYNSITKKRFLRHSAKVIQTNFDDFRALFPRNFHEMAC